MLVLEASEKGLACAVNSFRLLLVFMSLLSRLIIGGYLVLIFLFFIRRDILRWYRLLSQQKVLR